METLLEKVMHVWPWMGLGAAVVILILLFGTNLLRSTKTGSRWKDPHLVCMACCLRLYDP